MQQVERKRAGLFGAVSLIWALLAPGAGPAAAAESKLPPTASAGETADAEMVEVPAGPFFYGCFERADTVCDIDELPSGSFTLPAFSIDRTEVTVAAYRRCVEAKACSAPPVTAPPACNWDKPDRDQHPINCVELADARRYCAWAGKRVPSETEWEKAARGVDARIYPWGNRFDPTFRAVCFWVL